MDGGVDHFLAISKKKYLLKGFKTKRDAFLENNINPLFLSAHDIDFSIARFKNNWLIKSRFSDATAGGFVCM